MRVTRSEFKRIVNGTRSEIMQGHTFPSSTVISLTPENELASRNIQLILFSMGYGWRFPRSSATTSVEVGLISLYIFSTTNRLAQSRTMSAKEMDDTYGHLSNYVILDVTDITRRHCNFEGEE